MMPKFARWESTLADMSPRTGSPSTATRTSAGSLISYPAASQTKLSHHYHSSCTVTSTLLKPFLISSALSKLFLRLSALRWSHKRWKLFAEKYQLLALMNLVIHKGLCKPLLSTYNMSDIEVTIHSLFLTIVITLIGVLTKF